MHICGNVLKLSDYPKSTTEPTYQPTELPLKKTLREWLDSWGVAYEVDTDEAEKYFVECPYKQHHTDGICKPKDAYVFVNESGKFAYHCSHASCKSGGRATWESFKEGHGIRNASSGGHRVHSSEPPEPVRLPVEETDKIGRSKASGVSARDLQRILDALSANEVIMLTSRDKGGCQITRIN